MGVLPTLVEILDAAHGWSLINLMIEYQSILFLEPIFPRFDHLVRPGADNPPIKGRVVNPA